MKNTMFHKFFCTVLTFMLVISVVLCGCGGGNNASSAESTAAAENATAPTIESDGISDRHLPIRLSTALEEDFYYRHFTSAELNESFTEGLNYLNVTDVTIEINGEERKLEEAFRDGLLTTEDIFYFARKDAADGICQETYKSLHGLTNYTYLYPEYELLLIYDVQECPDGQQRLISFMEFSPADSTTSRCLYFKSGENGVYAEEDWGLSFEVESVSPTGIHIICTQAKGQQIGYINLMGYLLDIEDGYVSSMEGISLGSNCVQAPPFDDMLINMDGTTDIILDWSSYCGELPSGDYFLLLDFEDIYDESQVHPLMVNYYDLLGCRVDFTVP